MDIEFRVVNARLGLFKAARKKHLLIDYVLIENEDVIRQRRFENTPFLRRD